METILIHPQSKEQIKAFEQMAKALKVPFDDKIKIYSLKGHYEK